MKPRGCSHSTGALAEEINADFVSHEAIVEQYKAAGARQFGSGWAWLILKNGTPNVTKTDNANHPLTHDQKARLTMDARRREDYLGDQNYYPE